MTSTRKQNRKPPAPFPQTETMIWLPSMGKSSFVGALGLGRRLWNPSGTQDQGGCLDKEGPSGRPTDWCGTSCSFKSCHIPLWTWLHPHLSEILPPAPSTKEQRRSHSICTLSNRPPTMNPTADPKSNPVIQLQSCLTTVPETVPSFWKSRRRSFTRQNQFLKDFKRCLLLQMHRHQCKATRIMKS